MLVKRPFYKEFRKYFQNWARRSMESGFFPWDNIGFSKFEVTTPTNPILFVSTKAPRQSSISMMIPMNSPHCLHDEQ